jgi:hypothetical protein
MKKQQPMAIAKISLHAFLLRVSYRIFAGGGGGDRGDYAYL